MYVSTCLALPGFSPSRGPALSQIPAAHSGQMILGAPGGCCSLLGTGTHWKEEKVDFCRSSSFLLSVESPLGHFPQCSGSQKAQIKGSESLMSGEFEDPGCSFAQQIVFKCLLSSRPWEG